MKAEEKIKWADVLKVLRGIDQSECDHDEGWWETSDGARFGAERLHALKNLLTPVLTFE